MERVSAASVRRVTLEKAVRSMWTTVSRTPVKTVAPALIKRTPLCVCVCPATAETDVRETPRAASTAGRSFTVTAIVCFHDDTPGRMQRRPAESTAAT